MTGDNSSNHLLIPETSQVIAYCDSSDLYQELLEKIVEQLDRGSTKECVSFFFLGGPQKN